MQLLAFRFLNDTNFLVFHVGNLNTKLAVLKMDGIVHALAKGVG